MWNGMKNEGKMKRTVWLMIVTMALAGVCGCRSQGYVKKNGELSERLVGRYIIETLPHVFMGEIVINRDGTFRYEFYSDDEKSGEAGWGDRYEGVCEVKGDTIYMRSPQFGCIYEEFFSGKKPGNVTCNNRFDMFKIEANGRVVLCGMNNKKHWRGISSAIKISDKTEK